MSIEEPFSILPLDAICDSIEANIRELRSTHSPQTGGGSGKARAPAARDIIQLAMAEAAANGMP